MSDQYILHAEGKWKKRIIQCMSKLYEGQWLPSHDIGHHYRVWKNVCELSIALEKNILLPTNTFMKNYSWPVFFTIRGY